MSLRLIRHGKLLRLPRLNSSYRKLKAKILTISTWLMGLFLLAGQAAATYIPANPADLLASVKPVNAVATALSEPTPEPEAPTGSTQPLAEGGISEERVPEISIEITAALYVPPRVTYSGPSAGRFPFGQCTYYVSTRRDVTWSGNGGEWYRNAQAAGRSVGQAPQVGAIMVSFEGNPLGHVAYVEEVYADGSFLISEMNYLGQWGKVTSRTVRLGDFYIVGFIY